MDRRRFLKSVALMSAAFATRSHGGDSLATREARAFIAAEVAYVKPAVLPKVINVFLYGGPSELAGNLVNIDEINSITVNKYPAAILTGGAGHTANHFWAAAGGTYLEAMLKAGQMSLYRTVNRVKDDNKAHGRSIEQNLFGSPDIGSGGMAAKLAALMAVHRPFSKELDQLFLPFVSFEGSSRLYHPGDKPASIPFELKHVTLDTNPTAANSAFARSTNPYLPAGTDNDAIEALVSTVAGNVGEMNRAFANRAKLAAFVAETFNATAIDRALPTDPATNLKIAYPNTNFGISLKSAVSLAVLNADTIFISVNGGGPGWDDHNVALNNYPTRMNNLMSALSVAAKHLQLAGRNDVVINVFGDFGRNAYINEALGWDHGNNQNFYTVGGSGIPGRRLGKLVGTTRIINDGTSRVFTTPAVDSYQFEPFGVAASVYKYFGVQDPKVLTDGSDAIDESVPSIALV